MFISGNRVRRMLMDMGSQREAHFPGPESHRRVTSSQMCPTPGDTVT